MNKPFLLGGLFLSTLAPISFGYAQSPPPRPSLELRRALFGRTMTNQLASISTRQQSRRSDPAIAPLTAITVLPLENTSLRGALATHRVTNAPGWMAPGRNTPAGTGVHRSTQPVTIQPGLVQSPVPALTASINPARRDTLPTGSSPASVPIQLIRQPIRPVSEQAPSPRPIRQAQLIPQPIEPAPAPTAGSISGAEVPVSEIDNSPLPAEVAMIARRSVLPMISIRPQNVIASYALELPFNKTVSIIFPVAIKSVDLGSRQIIADKASDVENVLKVKAAQIGFNETNFSVITTDGKFYSFVAGYNEYPGVLALNLAANARQEFSSAGGGRYRTPTREYGIDSDGAETGPMMGTIQFSGIRASQSEIVGNCEKVLGKGRTVRHLGVTANLMSASVRGFYVHGNVMYVKVRLQNKSNINYDLDYMRFFIVDNTQAKKTTLQELEVLPIYSHPESQLTIDGKSSIEQVLAFPKFTIPDNKHIVVQINEAGGGRALEFVMNNEDIMHSGKL